MIETLFPMIKRRRKPLHEPNYKSQEIPGFRPGCDNSDLRIVREGEALPIKMNPTPEPVRSPEPIVPAPLAPAPQPVKQRKSNARGRRVAAVV